MPRFNLQQIQARKKSKLYEAKIPYSVTIFNSTPRRASICDKKMEAHCGKKKLYTETT